MPDALLHLAWTVEPKLFWTAPENTEWIEATVQLARSASDAGVGRIVGVGTCFEYAWADDGDCDENTTPIAPTTPYAVAKDAARRALTKLSAERDFSFAWARLFFLYGPFEHPSRSGAVARHQSRPRLAGASVERRPDLATLWTCETPAIDWRHQPFQALRAT